MDYLFMIIMGWGRHAQFLEYKGPYSRSSEVGKQGQGVWE